MKAIGDQGDYTDLDLLELSILGSEQLESLKIQTKNKMDEVIEKQVIPLSKLFAKIEQEQVNRKLAAGHTFAPTDSDLYQPRKKPK